MTTPIIRHHIDHPSAWKASDFKSQDGRTPVYSGDAWSDHENKRIHVG